LLSVRETSDGSTNLLTITYTYDALGDQVSQSEWKSSGGGVVTTDHAYDDQGNVWADVTTSNVVVMRYIRAASTNQLLAQIDGSGNLSWYLTDNQGSVRDIVSAAGTTVTDHIDYGAFGNIILETNAAATGRTYLYTGLPEDRDTGIVQAQHRTLLVTTGQWMEEDPSGFQAGDQNLRRYVGNNPINSTDPSGLQVIARAGPPAASIGPPQPFPPAATIGPITVPKPPPVLSIGAPPALDLKEIFNPAYVQLVWNVNFNKLNPVDIPNSFSITTLPGPGQIIIPSSAFQLIPVNADGFPDLSWPIYACPSFAVTFVAGLNPEFVIKGGDGETIATLQAKGVHVVEFTANKIDDALFNKKGPSQLFQFAWNLPLGKTN
jgi:RHS repeat-associated protein